MSRSHALAREAIELGIVPKSRTTTAFELQARTTLTCERAALHATQLGGFPTVNGARKFKQLLDQSKKLGNTKEQPLTPIEVSLENNVDLAFVIATAMLDDLKQLISTDEYDADYQTPLKIAFLSEDEEGTIYLERSTVTKKSAAQWLNSKGFHNEAKNLVPDINENDEQTIDDESSTCDSKNASSNHPTMIHETMPMELKVALQLWEDLYLNENKPEHLPHTTAAVKWLKNNIEDYENMSANKLKRIISICTPDKNKSF